jgi:pimeloyl-ACP methyl ester carboxylesterase
MQVVVDSLLTHYHRLGESHGQTVVIVHGWGDSSAGWLEFDK